MDNTDKIKQIHDQVLKGVNSKNKDIQLDKWLEYLEENLSFPFDATILEAEESTVLRWKDHVKVKKIDDYVDPYGVLMEIRKERKKYIVPLCEMEIIDKDSNNYIITEAFMEWWSNNYW